MSASLPESGGAHTNANEPAYPVIPPVGMDSSSASGYPFPSAGLTRREYFAARAPADPQAWFEPVLPTPRPSLPDRFLLPPEVRKDIEVAWDAGCDPTLPEAEAWLEMYAEAQKTLVAWDNERLKQRLIQWPWTWADAVLKAGTP